MRVIGLCGGSGSGKGTAAQYFQDFGFVHIDTDAIYHTITSYCSPCVRELVDAFGNEVFHGGKLDRKLLFKAVFEGEDTGEKQRLLNRITHKHIRKRTEELIEKYRQDGKCFVLIDAPMLFESEFDNLCSTIICVVAEENIRINRIMERDGIEFTKARTRIRSQLPDDYLISRSDYCIKNNGTEEEFKAAVCDIANKIINLKEDI